MRRSADVGEWLVALGRSDDARAALAADYAVGSTHLDAPTGGPYEVFLSARPQDALQREPQPEPLESFGSNVQALLELSSSSSESEDDSGGPEHPTVLANLPTSCQAGIPVWPQLDGRTPRFERTWWRDPLPRRSLFAADPPPPPPPPPEPEPEPAMPLTWCTCSGHGASCNHDRRFLLPERLRAEPASIEQRFGLSVHTVRFPRCNMRAAVTLAPGEVLQIRLGSSALTCRDANVARELGKPARPDLWRLHGRVHSAALRLSTTTDSAELQVFTALAPASKVGSQWSVSTRVVLRCLRSIGGPTGYAWVDVTITPSAKQMRESQPLVGLISTAARGVEDPQVAARRHQARLLGVFRALDREKTGHVSLVDLQSGLQRNHRGWRVSISEIRSFLAQRLGRSSVGLEQVSFGEFVQLVAGLPIPTVTPARMPQTQRSRSAGARQSLVGFGADNVRQRLSRQAIEVGVDPQPAAEPEPEPEPEPLSAPKTPALQPDSASSGKLTGAATESRTLERQSSSDRYAALPHTGRETETERERDTRSLFVANEPVAVSTPLNSSLFLATHLTPID